MPHFPKPWFRESRGVWMVQIAGVVEPNAAHRRAYDEQYARYRATYPALRELMHELAR